MKRNPISGLLLLMFFVSHYLNAQDSSLPEVIPPSPNSAKLVQFDITPTSPYTGKQNLSIPLYNIDFDGAGFPIALAYASGGIKASEEAGYVGLGWNLSFGGSVSRTVKGKDDLASGGWIYDTQVLPETYDPLANDKGEIDGSPILTHPFWTYLSGGGIVRDTEPDIFSYNFMGYSGTFVLSKGLGSNTTVQKLSEDATRISWDHSDDFFTIETPNGFTGLFKVREWVTSIGSSDQGGGKLGCDLNKVDILSILNANKRVVTSWYLEQVISPNGRTLDFEYEVKANGYSDYISQSAKVFSERKSISDSWTSDPNDRFYQSCSYTVIEHVYPKRIYSSYNGLDIDFSKVGRDDLSILLNYYPNFAQERGEVNGVTFNPIAPQRITGFTVDSTDPLSSLNHTISFSQDYFNTASTDPFQDKRLRLNGVTIDDQQYSFEYENGTSGLPDKSTFGVDYWGYYNGKDANTSLLPVTLLHTTMENFLQVSQVNSYLANDMFFYQSDNRKADFNYGKAGLLKKVTYPTGGYTDYEYEAHEYYLEGREVQPVTGSENAIATASYSELNTVESANVEYNGFVLSGSGGSCSSPVNVSYSISCPAHFSDYTCTPVDNWGGMAVEIVRVNAGGGTTTVFQKQFWELSDAINNSSPDYNVTDNLTLNLTPGTYKVRAKSVLTNSSLATPGPHYARGGISISFPKSCSSAATPVIVEDNFDQMAGGARIASITNYNGDGNIAAKRSFEYTDPNVGGAFSSGRLMNPLMHWNVDTRDEGLIHYYTFISGSALSDGAAAQGSHIGYTYVRERFEGAEGGNTGFRDHTFLNVPNVPGWYGLSNRFTYSQTNGQTDKVATWTTGNGQVLETDINNHATNEGLVRGVKVNWMGSDPGIFETYSLQRMFVSPAQIIEEQYVDGGIRSVDKVTNYTYNDKFLKASESTTNSNGDAYLTEYRYVTDLVTPSGVTSNMITNHHIGTPVEVVNKINGTVRSAVGTKFKASGQNFLPDKQYLFDPGKGNYTAVTGNQTFSGGYDERLEFLSYEQGKVREYQNQGGVVTTILWGYNGVYPVAQIENASYSEVSAIVNLSIINNPTSQAALRTELDNLRNHADMKGAIITSMTYDPGVGLLSQTSPNGIITYYEYDTYGRLVRVKDRDGNIIKLVEYAYQQIVPTTQN